VTAGTIRSVLPQIGPRAFLRAGQVALGLVVLNIVSGAAVRLSDSGLGCPDWPDCSVHHLTPPLALHPAIEFSNRLVVVALCLAAATVVLLALRRQPRRRDLTWLSAGLIGGVLAEAVLGGVVVYSHLNPYVVMTHFMVGIGLLTVAVVLVLRAGRSAQAGVPMVGAGVRRLGRLMTGVLVLAIAAGTATTGAGPHAGGKGAKRLPVPLVDMARTHAEIVIVLVALTLGLLYMLETTKAPATVTTRARLLLAAMAAQGVVGYTQYFSHLPPLLVGVHVFGVTILWTAMLWFYDGLFHHPADDAAAADAGSSSGAAVVTPPVGAAAASSAAPSAVSAVAPAGAPPAVSGTGR